jgi:hypothetical protein
MAALQGLSAKFRNRLKLAVVGKADKSIARALNVTSYPALRVLPAGNSSQTSEAVHYKGKISFFAIDLFLLDYAKPSASDAPKEKAQDSKRDKSKAESNKADKSKAESNKADKSKAESNKTDKINAESKKSTGKTKEGGTADAKGDAKEQGASAGGKQAEAPKNQKAPSGKASAGSKQQKAAKSAPPEPPVYGGDSSQKNAREQRKGEL